MATPGMKLMKMKRPIQLSHWLSWTVLLLITVMLVMRVGWVGERLKTAADDVEQLSSWVEDGSALVPETAAAADGDAATGDPQNAGTVPEEVRQEETDALSSAESSSSATTTAAPEEASQGGDTPPSCARDLTLVVSTGGVGTTAAMGILIRSDVHTNNQADQDYLKHRPYAYEREQIEKTFQCSMEQKVKQLVYVFGDPTHSVFSLYRRNYQGGSVRKLRTDATDYALAETVIDFANKQEDTFQLEKHFDGYLRQACSNQHFPTLFLRAEELKDHVEEYFQFVETTPSQDSLDFVDVLRGNVKGDWTARYAETLGGQEMVTTAIEKLNELYSGLNRKYEQMGDFRIVQGDCSSLPIQVDPI